MKKTISVLLSVFMLCACLQGPVFAEEADPEGMRASSYLDMYGAYLDTNGTSGQLVLVFQVVATRTMDSVGVLGLTVRNSNGTIKQIIWGSTANGLIDTNDWFHAGAYTLNLTSGNAYYCEVIVVAADANGGDSRAIYTNQVTCP